MPDSSQDDAQLIGKIRHLKHSAQSGAAPAGAVAGVDLSEPAPARPVGPDIPKFNIKPPAKPARPRKRHRFLVFTFMLLVVSPIVLIAYYFCLLYTSPSPRDRTRSRMPSSA